MKKMNNMIIISIFFLIHSHHFKQKTDSTISLDIKTWKYTDNNNFNYYLNFNPHAYYKLSENDPKFIYLDLILNNIYICWVTSRKNIRLFCWKIKYI